MNENLHSPVADLIRTTVREIEPTAEIILYGSRARGDNRPDSDWDVVVILDKPQMTFKDRGNLGYDLWSKGLEHGEEINAFEYTKKEWENYPPSLFKHNVLIDGVRL